MAVSNGLEGWDPSQPSLVGMTTFCGAGATPRKLATLFLSECLSLQMSVYSFACLGVPLRDAIGRDSAMPNSCLSFLFNRHALSQVAWLIDVAAQLDCEMIRKELQRYHGQNRSDEIRAFRNKNHVIGELGDRLFALR
jgi:hypothetical protein